MKKQYTPEEIKEIQEKRQRPLTDREDAMESLENVILDLNNTEEEYKQWRNDIGIRNTESK